MRVFVQDYEELSLSLSELPLNDHTASELVRLCLRHHDADSLDNESDSGGDDVDADDEVVCHSFYSSAHADVVTLPLPCTLHSSQPAYLCLSLHVYPCMPVVPLVPSDCSTLISCLVHLYTHHLELAASALQPLKSGTLFLYLSVPVPVVAKVILGTL